MSEVRGTGPGFDRSQEVDPRQLRRSVRSPEQAVRETLSKSDVAFALFVIISGVLVLSPDFWLFAAAFVGLYAVWLSGLKFRLPFRTPMTWRDIDYSDPKPGRDDAFNKAQGLVYLGTDMETRQELHITNSDARRHIFALGTTGSGKALPLDALVLTPSGWRRNRDLAPGDEVMRPDGRPARIASIHPQGHLKLYRVSFADGRFVDCSGEHLWKICMTPPGREPDWSGETLRQGSSEAVETRIEGGELRLMTTSDIGMMMGVGEVLSGGVALHAPLTSPQPGRTSVFLDVQAGVRAADAGISSVIRGPAEMAGDVDQRRAFLQGFISGREARVNEGFLEIACRDAAEAHSIRAVAWSLGGIALLLDDPAAGPRLMMRVPGSSEIAPHVAGIDTVRDPVGIEIMDVEPLDEGAECLCIRLEDDEGLFVTDNFVVTHNTEFLLGLVAQPLSWGSGFLFVDGKGTPEFYARVWSLAKRFGREDDVRLVNFTGVSGEQGDTDAPSGSIGAQSNTLNPFARGSADQLTNLVVSLMGDDGKGGGGDMWKNRAIQLVSTLIRALVEMRDRGEVLLDVQTIRDYVPMGLGVKRAQPKPGGMRGRGAPMGRQRATAAGDGGDEDELSAITEAEWDDIRRRAGMIELYLRSLNGEFSEATRLALKGFFDSLPGFSLNKALQGQEQDQKTLEQYGYLSMQLTKPLGSMADDFGHIFRTPLGEVDMDDIVYNRRILVVLLPALQKATDEVRNLGRIVVAMSKSMMGAASGSEVVGDRRTIIDSAPTRSPSPFIAVFDEAGYYLVDGLNVMAAQARSLGFCIVVGAQDIQAMKAQSPHVAESVIANTFLNAYGATVDATESLQFIQKKLGEGTVAMSSGMSREQGALDSKFVDRGEVSFQKVERVTVGDLRSLSEGQFYMVLQGQIVKARTFFVGTDFTRSFGVNKFLKVRGPDDRAPNLDTTDEEAFRNGMAAASRRLFSETVDEAERLARDVDVLTRPLGRLSLMIEAESPAPVAMAEAEAVIGLALGLVDENDDVGDFEGDLDDIPEFDDETAAFGEDDEEVEDSGGISPALRPKRPLGVSTPPRRETAGDEAAFVAPPPPPAAPEPVSGQAFDALAAPETPEPMRAKAEIHVTRKTETDVASAAAAAPQPFSTDPPAPGAGAQGNAGEARKRREKTAKETASAQAAPAAPPAPAPAPADATLLQRVKDQYAERVAQIDRRSGMAEADVKRTRRHIMESGQMAGIAAFVFPPINPSKMNAQLDKIMDSVERKTG